MLSVYILHQLVLVLVLALLITGEGKPGLLPDQMQNLIN